MKKIFITSVLIFCLARQSFEQIDYWAYLTYFNGSPINHIPKGISIPDKDRQSRFIMNAIISGSSDTELTRSFPDSLKIKVTALMRGGVLVRKDSRYQTTFPILIGKQRDQLQKVVTERAKIILPSIDSLLSTLNAILSNNPEMIFHFLWSRIIDECWWNLYNAEFDTNQGPPSIAFIVYPFHRFQCGTNYDYTPDTGQIALSWSYNIFSDFESLPETVSFYNLAMHKPVSTKDKNFFFKHGLVDSNSVVRIFTYYEHGTLDSICDILKKKYIELVKGLYDYRELGKAFHIAPDELFILISHETAYQVFELLYGEHESFFSPIIKEDNPRGNFSSLVSIRLPKP